MILEKIKSGILKALGYIERFKKKNGNKKYKTLVKLGSYVFIQFYKIDNIVI